MDLTGRDEKKRGRGKPKSLYKKCQGGIILNRCLRNERFRSSHCAKERNEGVGGGDTSYFFFRSLFLSLSPKERCVACFVGD